MANIKHTPEIKAEAIRLYVEEKYSSEAVAEMLGISSTSVIIWLKKAGIPRRNSATPKREFSAEELADIVKMYRDGEQIRKICHKHKIGAYSTLRKLMMGNGYKMDRPNKPIKPEPKLQTLCWDCANAVCGCSWSKSFTPVEGWKAEKTILDYNGRGVDSYCVFKCPQFVKG